MKQEFKAHPLMIISSVKFLLPILLIPLTRGLIQYYRNRRVIPTLNWGILIFFCIILFGVLRWLSFRLVCDEKVVLVKTGVIFVRKALIPIEGLSSVQSDQSPIYYIFAAVTYRINTEAGSREKTDYKFKLSRKNSHRVSELLYGKKNSTPVRFSAFKIAVLAAATSTSFAGMLIGVPILNSAARLLGLGFEEVLDEITNVSNRFETYFPPIVNTVTLILLFGYLISFIYSFLRYLNFRLFLEENKIEVRSGFFVKLRTAFKKSSVNDVKIEQSFLMLILRRFSLKVNVGGYGEAKSESEVLVPSGKYSEIRMQFSDYFPFLKPSGKAIKSKRGLLHKNRYLFWAEIYFIILAVVAVFSAYIFDEFGRFILFSTFVLGSGICYYAYLCLSEYYRGSLRVGETIFAGGKKGLRRCQLYCPKERVGQIEIKRYIPDHYFKTCNVKITVCSETADNITVHHLDYTQVKNAIFECYEINE